MTSCFSYVDGGGDEEYNCTYYIASTAGKRRAKQRASPTFAGLPSSLWQGGEEEQ